MTFGWILWRSRNRFRFLTLYSPFSVKLRIVPKAYLGLPIFDVPVITTVYYIILFYFDWLFMNGCEKKPNNKLFLSQIKSLHVLVGMTHYTQKKSDLYLFFSSRMKRRFFMGLSIFEISGLLCRMGYSKSNVFWAKKIFFGIGKVVLID